jgi:hypothetical protein
MKNQQEQVNLNIDLKNTQSITTPSGNVVFQQGVLLRKVSKFILGSNEDSILPIPIFFDPDSGKILLETIPMDLREEYKDMTI